MLDTPCLKAFMKANRCFNWGQGEVPELGPAWLCSLRTIWDVPEKHCAI